MKALAKSVEDRYQSAAAMRADIERYLAGKPVSAPSYRCRRHRVHPASPTTATSIFGGRRAPTTRRSRSAAAGR